MLSFSFVTRILSLLDRILYIITVRISNDNKNAKNQKAAEICDL